VSLAGHGWCSPSRPWEGRSPRPVSMRASPHSPAAPRGCLRPRIALSPGTGRCLVASRASAPLMRARPRSRRRRPWWTRCRAGNGCSAGFTSQEARRRPSEPAVSLLLRAQPDRKRQRRTRDSLDEEWEVRLALEAGTTPPRQALSRRAPVRPPPSRERPPRARTARFRTSSQPRLVRLPLRAGHTVIDSAQRDHVGPDDFNDRHRHAGRVRDRETRTRRYVAPYRAVINHPGPARGRRFAAAAATREQ
jgi:hypothetical protein